MNRFNCCAVLRGLLRGVARHRCVAGWAWVFFLASAWDLYVCVLSAGEVGRSTSTTHPGDPPGDGHVNAPGRGFGAADGQKKDHRNFRHGIQSRVAMQILPELAAGRGVEWDGDAPAIATGAFRFGMPPNGVNQAGCAKEDPQREFDGETPLRSGVWRSQASANGANEARPHCFGEVFIRPLLSPPPCECFCQSPE